MLMRWGNDIRSLTFSTSNVCINARDGGEEARRRSIVMVAAQWWRRDSGKCDWLCEREPLTCKLTANRRRWTMSTSGSAVMTGCRRAAALMLQWGHSTALSPDTVSPRKSLRRLFASVSMLHSRGDEEVAKYVARVRQRSDGHTPPRRPLRRLRLTPL